MEENSIYLKMGGKVESCAIMLLDKKGNIASQSKGTKKLKGYTPNEIIGENISIFYTEEAQKSGLSEKLIKKAAANGEATYEGWSVRKNGTRFWGNVVITALYDKAGDITGFAKITHDLSEKQTGAISVHATPPMLHDEFDQNNLYTLINNTGDQMWSVDRDYKLITSNKAFDEIVLNITGTSISHNTDVLANGFTEEQLIRYRRLYERAFSGETFKMTEYTELPVAFWSELSFHPIRKGNEIVGVGCYAHNITDQKEAEEKMLNTQRLYAFISQINQTISHSTEEQTLLNEACRIAVTIGKFELAWICIPDTINKKLNIVAHVNVTASEMEFFDNLIYDADGPTATVLRSGELSIINDFEDEREYSSSKAFAKQRGLKSYIVLPLTKSGITIGTYNIFSTHINFFNAEEIKLLKEIAGDISFALNLFEKEKHRRQIEKQVIDSELRLKEAQAIAHIGSWEYNFNTGIAEWSEEACRIYGFAPKDNCMSYESWVSFIHPDDRWVMMKTLKEREETLSSSAFYHRIIRKDGEVRYLYTQWQFKFNPEGIPVSIQGVSHDVTEMKDAKNALAQSEANLRQIMDLIPQSIFAKDYDGAYIFVNKNFASLYGLTTEQMIHKNIIETIPVADEAKTFLEEDKEVILSGEPKTIPEHTFTDYQGNIHVFHTVKVPFTIAGTNKRAALGITFDITEQKKADADRTNMIADIVRRNNDLEQFSYIVSHNLRAPVANILGLVHIMQTVGITEEEEKMVVEGLSVATQNLDMVIRDINNILDLRYVVKEKREKVNFEQLLQEVKLTIGDIINNGGVKITSDFSEVQEIITVKSYLHSIFLILYQTALNTNAATNQH